MRGTTEKWRSQNLPFLFSPPYRHIIVAFSINFLKHSPFLQNEHILLFCNLYLLWNIEMIYFIFLSCNFSHFSCILKRNQKLSVTSSYWCREMCGISWKLSVRPCWWKLLKTFNISVKDGCLLILNNYIFWLQSSVKTISDIKYIPVIIILIIIIQMILVNISLRPILKISVTLKLELPHI